MARSQRLDLIDAHLHVWDPVLFSYAWMTPGSPLFRQHALDDIAESMQALHITGGLLVEAANSADEIPWLLGCAKAAGPRWGVIGSLPLEAADAPERIAHLAGNPAFRGIRLNWLSPRLMGDTLARALHAMADHRLVLDILPAFDCLVEIIACAAAFPALTVVLEHMGGGDFSAAALAHWRSAIAPAGDLPNIAVKFSGWGTTDFLPDYLAAADALFGADRLMHGSNWPVCGDIALVTRAHLALTEQYSHGWRARFFHDTAARIYGI
ncbi:MAG: amidohydrolase family protein [Pleurocapsa minor GSE-CHR-MK-17-07R]|jgi:L-fuconolactonase|nr:amidohydrolase family protein [Pleurocapsa minor GSE-CHR-MK 17-07R]